LEEHQHVMARNEDSMMNEAAEQRDLFGIATATFRIASNGDQEDDHVIRVLLADVHALVREGTRRLLETETDVEVVAEAASGEEAIEAAKRLHPDIAIMDIAMPGMGGIAATCAIKVCSPQTAILVLSAYDDEPYLMAFLEAGAAGFLLKNVHGEELIEAIRAVSRGESVLQSSVVEKIMRRLSARPDTVDRSTAALSEREFDVLRLAARGLANKEIADRLGLSIRTVHAHLASIFTKMHVGSRTEAVLQALRQGMIALQDTYDTQ
jgi:NarL family two-component system response regulator LiaR